MGMAIAVRGHGDDVVLIAGGTHATLPLVDEVAETMKREHPRIYDAAFKDLEWGGDVYLSDLDVEDFNIVVDATHAAYERFINDFPDAETKYSGEFRQWQRYFSALRSDPRFRPR